ncbi:hypothetical protein OHS70_38785 (plasmid) [Streptomyces sp. NBC_00390]|uniref:hypothetical protein n=1 Tax=Streptomyces sp. NBC_00390 TaxID=2975736 RepID=UPI002E1D77C4
MDLRLPAADGDLPPMYRGLVPASGRVVEAAEPGRSLASRVAAMPAERHAALLAR